MRPLRTCARQFILGVAAIGVAIALGAPSAHAQGRYGTQRLSSTKLPDPTKAVLNKIKLTKPQQDSVKKLQDTYKAKLKVLSDAASGRGSSAGRGRGPNSGTGRQDGDVPVRPPSARTPTVPTYVSMQISLQEWYIDDVRALLTPDQISTFEANVLAHNKKVDEVRQRATGRGRPG